MRTGTRLMLFYDGSRYVSVTKQVFDNRQQVLFIVGHKSVISDFNQPFWQHMLQEPVDKFKNRQCDGFPLVGRAVFEPEGDVVIFQLFNAVVGDSDSVDIGGQVL